MLTSRSEALGRGASDRRAQAAAGGRRARVAPGGGGVESAADRPFDVAIVGAGPAGLSAAVTAADAGVRVVLIDAEATLGGQFWRHPARSAEPGAVRAAEVADLHHDLNTYRGLLRRIDFHRVDGRITVLSRHQVITPEARPDGFVLRTLDAANRSLHTVAARALVLAPGAYDLQIPFPGWDLPGVLTAGGAQSLLKGHDVVPGKRIVVAGTGPFLLPVAAGLAARGADVLGVYEAASPRRWLRHKGPLARNAAKLAEGAGYAAALAQHRVPYRTRSTVIAAHGTDRLAAVTVASLDPHGRVIHSSASRLAADTLAVGWGFVPQLELPLGLGCATRVGPDGQAVVAVDDGQRSSVPGVFVAGEACGIGGAALAVVEGTIAGGAAARPPGEASPIHGAPLRRREALRAFADALAAVYPVPAFWVDEIRPDTVVCRCEEVTAGRIREVAERYGATDARTAKLLARPGMGWCQGRICGYATECLTAAWTGTVRQAQPAERPIATPVPLGLIAEWADER